MGLTVGVSGTVVRDHFVNPARIFYRGGSYWLEADGQMLRIELLAPINGRRKVLARFDPAALTCARRKRFGGGGYNAAVEMRGIAPDVELRYSDSGTWNPELEADLAERGIGYRHRDLYPVQDNIVTGDAQARDKLIFKSQVPMQALQSAPEDQVPWVADGGVVLVNSDKHRAWVTRLAGAAARGRLRLFVVLTPALPPVYLWEAVIPHAGLIVAGLDELGEALQIPVRTSVSGRMEALSLLARSARSPLVHLTLGNDGVLVSDPEEMVALQVRLAPAKWREVQAHLRPGHDRLCGCGDSYAGAVTIHAVAGRSVFGGGTLHPSPFAAAAIAGSAAAIRRFGYEGPLTPGDFVVTTAGYLGEAWPELGPGAA